MFHNTAAAWLTVIFALGCASGSFAPETGRSELLIKRGAQLSALHCDSDYESFGGWCYRKPDVTELSYDEAVEYCRREGGDLVSIHDENENYHVSTLYSGCMIGLRNDGAGDLSWSDGTPMDYTSVADNFVEYADYFGYCARMENSTWMNAECDTGEWPFVCKKNPATAPTGVPPTTCIKDVILLIDVSNSTTDAEFQQMKDFILQQESGLLSVWPVAPELIEVAVLTYTSNINFLVDFDVSGIDELLAILSVSLYHSNVAKPNISRVLKFAASIERPRSSQNVPAVTVLLAASSDPADIATAADSAYKLTSDGNILITVAFGRANEADLRPLASSPDFSMSSPSFSGSAKLANDIRDHLCVVAPTHFPTAKPTPALISTTSHADIRCKSDIVLMIDTSSALGSNDEYIGQVKFLRNLLAPQWFINADATEAALITYGTHVGSIFGGFKFANNSQLDASLATLENRWYGAVPSITLAFEMFIALLERNTTRIGAQTVVILFTYSSGYDDIQAATQYLNDLAAKNVWIYVVCKGNGCNLQYLNAISGSVIFATSYDDTLATKLNTMVCVQNTPPGPMPRPTTPTYA